MCTGAPCTAGIRAVIAAATCDQIVRERAASTPPSVRSSGRRAGTARLVTYIGDVAALLDVPQRHPGSGQRVSNVKLQPMWNATRSSRHSPVTSAVSSASSPSFHTR